VEIERDMKRGLEMANAFDSLFDSIFGAKR
jgi:hypothetical protein